MPHPPVVSLQEVTRETLREVLSLAVHPAQQRFVASNAVSIAQAHFEPQAWFRAIHDGERLVGFVMVEDASQRPGHGPVDEVGLWRLMVDAAHQRRGIGRAALQVLVADLRLRHPGLRRLVVQAVPGPDGPKGFYERFGFVSTGAWDDGEEVLVLELGGWPVPAAAAAPGAGAPSSAPTPPSSGT